MKKKFIGGLRTISENSYLNCLVGLIMLATGLAEAGDTLWHDLGNLKFGAHHGVIVFGLLHAIKSLPDMFEGIEYFDHGAESK